MDPDLLEALLGLEGGRVEMVAGATEDYARLLQSGDLEPIELDATAADSTDRAQRVLSIAGAYATSASLWMLLDPHRARPLFDEAATQHEAAGSGQADIFHICAHPREAPVAPPFADGARRPRAPEVSILTLLALVARGELHPEEVEVALGNLPEVADQPRGLPTGKLRLPLGLYVDVLFEVAAIRGERVEPGPEFSAPATASYLNRVAEITSLARADQHHWAMPGLHGLPIEPEAVAPCALVDVATRDVLDLSVTEVVRPSTDGTAVASALVAHGLVDAEEGRGEPGRAGA